MKSPSLSFFLFGLILLAAQDGFAQRAHDYYKLGLDFLEQGKYEKAFETMSTAASLSKKQGDWPLYFKALAKSGETGFRLDAGHERRAFVLLRDGLEHAHKNNNDSLGNFYYYLGMLYRDMTMESDSAIQWIEKARIIYEKQHGENVGEVALCYAGLGWIYRYQRFDLFEAQRCFEKSLFVWSKLSGDHDYDLADSYYNLAVTFRAQGELEKSISYATRALQLVRKLKDVQFEGICHSLFGTIYMDMDSLTLAEHELQQAIEINLKTNQRRGDLIRYYSNLGLVCDGLGQPDHAIEYMRKSIAIERDGNLDQYQKFGIVHSWRMLADLLLKYNKPEQAWVALQKARQQLEVLVGKQKAIEANMFFGFSEYFFKTNQLDSALYYSQRTLEKGIKEFSPGNGFSNPSISAIENNGYIASRLMKNNLYIPDVMFRKAEVLHALYKKKQSPEYLQASLECFSLTEELLTRTRNAFDFEQAKWRTSDAYFKVYETPIDALMEIYEKSKSDSIASLLFQYFEKSKNKTLRDALAVAESYKKSNLPDSIVITLRVLQNRQHDIQNEIDEALSKGGTDPERISSLRVLITENDKKLKDIRDYVQATYPDYYRLKYSYTVASLAEIRRYVGERGVTLVEFFYGKDDVYGMVITGSTLEVKKLGKSESIASMIRDFNGHFSMAKKKTISQSDRFKNFVRNSSALYQTLLAPFGSLSTTKVVIVPDGLLNSIPFEALLTSSPTPGITNYRSLPYVLKTTEVSYAFFATSLLRESHKANGKKLLGFAYSGDDPYTGFTRSGGNSIPGTSAELGALKNIFSSGVFLSDTAATEGIFKELAPGFDLLHLALHGRGDDKNANLSYLLFRNSNADSLNDGRLYAYELYALNLQASLAVLSACETGLGRTIKTEGTFSMANAFAYSGCPNVLMSLWEVNDQTTADVMSSFYQYFADGNTIDGALSQAKRAYIEASDELSADPALWASFVAVGDMQYKLKTPPSVVQIILAVLGGVLLVLLGGVAYRFARKR